MGTTVRVASMRLEGQAFQEKRTPAKDQQHVHMRLGHGGSEHCVSASGSALNGLTIAVLDVLEVGSVHFARSRGWR